MLAQSQPADTAAIIQQLRQGNNGQALSLARQALSTRPGDCALLSLEGVASTGLKEPEDALKSFHKALVKCPAYLPALEGAAQLEYARTSPEAIVLLERIIAIQPESMTAQAMLASALRAANRCPEALPHFAAGESTFSKQPELAQGYAWCLVETGDLQKALVEYQELLASEPSDAVRYDVALLQWKTHAGADALATLEPLLSAGQDGPALSLASRISEERGDTPRAVSLLRTAILLSPREIDNYLDFADIAFAHKSFPVGIDILNTGLKFMPDAAPLYVARGVLEVQLTQPDAAIADFRHAHQLDPKLSFAEDAMGIMQSQQHQDAQSLALLQAQAKLHPEDPFLAYLLAEQLSEGNGDAGDANLQAAIAAAKRAALLDPKYGPAHDLLAMLYIRAQQPQLATKEAESALAQDPDDAQALYQELLAARRSHDDKQVQSLTARLNAARKQNASKQQSVDRYRLQESAVR